LRKGAEAEVGEAEAARVVPVGAVRAAQAREPAVAQALQAERVRARQPGGRKKDQALEALAREEDLQTLAGQVIPLTRQTGHSRDGPRHKIRLQHPKRTGSTARRRLKCARDHNVRVGSRSRCARATPVRGKAAVGYVSHPTLRKWARECRHLAPPLGLGMARCPASVILNLAPSTRSLVDTTNPARTNSDNWSTVKPCASITASVAPPTPHPSSSASARRS
jgi:hypothetical protein